MPDTDPRPGDRRVIQCNLREATSIATEGSRAYITLPNPGGGHERVEILIRSRSGRWVRKWEDIRRLDQFRAKTLPPEHPLYGEALYDWEPEMTATALQAARDRLTRTDA